jgi:hypothetical protein
MRGAAGNGLGTTIKQLRRTTTSGAAGNGLGATMKYLRRTTTSGAAGNGLGATMKYLRRTTSAAANNGLGTSIMAILVQYDGAIGLDYLLAHPLPP